MHNAALAALSARDDRLAGWSYVAFDVEPARLPEALSALGEHGFAGVNLTVPHKVLAVDLVSSLDEGAREAGAVNTLQREGGGWRGFNTDGYGLSAALREDLGVELRGSPVILLGAGGAARGAAVECLRAGCSGLWVMNRSRPNLDGLLSLLSQVKGGSAARALGPGVPAPEGAIVVNATSAGLRPGDDAPADLSLLPRPSAVFDMIYNPRETRLLAQARALGIRASNGLGMLVHQGARSLEIWTGVPAASMAPIMRAAASKALG
jgi:shikimate dehydrogenase